VPAIRLEPLSLRGDVTTVRTGRSRTIESNCAEACQIDDGVFRHDDALSVKESINRGD